MTDNWFKINWLSQRKNVRLFWMVKHHNFVANIQKKLNITHYPSIFNRFLGIADDTTEKLTK